MSKKITRLPVVRVERNEEDRIATWHGKDIGQMSRGELIDALDWCITQMRKTMQFSDTHITEGEDA